MDHASQLAGLFLFKDPVGILRRVPGMDHDGQARFPRNGDLSTEIFLLPLLLLVKIHLRRDLVIVQSDFADRSDLLFSLVPAPLDPGVQPCHNGDLFQIPGRCLMNIGGMDPGNRHMTAVLPGHFHRSHRRRVVAADDGIPQNACRSDLLHHLRKIL